MDCILLISCIACGIAAVVFGMWAFLKGYKCGLEAKNGAAPELFEQESRNENNKTFELANEISEMFRTDDGKVER